MGVNCRGRGNALKSDPVTRSRPHFDFDFARSFDAGGFDELGNVASLGVVRFRTGKVASAFS
jgi:hypothetical protein